MKERLIIMRQFQEGNSTTRCLMNKIYEVKINKKTDVAAAVLTSTVSLKCNQNFWWDGLRGGSCPKILRTSVRVSFLPRFSFFQSSSFMCLLFLLPQRAFLSTCSQHIPTRLRKSRFLSFFFFFKSAICRNYWRFKHRRDKFIREYMVPANYTVLHYWAVCTPSQGTKLLL